MLPDGGEAMNSPFGGYNGRCLMKSGRRVQQIVILEAFLHGCVSGGAVLTPHAPMRTIYDGRLKSDNPAARQQLILQRPRRPLTPAGLYFAGVAHAGNSQSSAEEGNAILDVYRSLIGQSYQDRDGNLRTIGAPDILVVTPYNAQVNLLKQILPIDARIGTVDKFQGQEAPVCLISMVTSSADELTRNIEFLFSVNRLNVAISRAQALAVVFASPRLLDVPCRTVEQMRLVNALAAIKDYEFRSSGPVNDVIPQESHLDAAAGMAAAEASLLGSVVASR